MIVYLLIMGTKNFYPLPTDEYCKIRAGKFEWNQRQIENQCTQKKLSGNFGTRLLNFWIFRNYFL